MNRGGQVSAHLPKQYEAQRSLVRPRRTEETAAAHCASAESSFAGSEQCYYLSETPLTTTTSETMHTWRTILFASLAQIS